MPEATCKCGRLTNSATSNYWDSDDGKPTQCYAAYDSKNGWVEGCSLHRADSFTKKFAQALINNEVPKTTLEIIDSHYA